VNISEIKEVIQEARDKFVISEVNESLPYHADLETIIIKAMEIKGYGLDGSGYDFQNKVRDLSFVAENGECVTINISV
jgi:hypothetical protein